MKKRAKVKIIFFGGVSLVLGVLFALMVQKGWFLTWHYKFSNFLYHQYGNEASTDIVLVAIDDKSFALKNASELRTLQFSKANYAQAISSLESAGAKAIGIDVILSENSSSADKSALVSVLKAHDNIVLAAEPKTPKTDGLKPMQDFIVPHPENIGSILFEPDRDNLIRRQQILFDDPVVPSAFAIRLAQLYLDLLPEDSVTLPGKVQLMPFAVRVGDRRFSPIAIPTDAQGRMMLNFFGPPGSFPSVSFVDAIQGEWTDRVTGRPINMNGKIAIIGEMGTGLHDEQYVPTSLGKPMSGVEIHANVLQTILGRRFLHDQAPLGVWGVSVALGILGLACFLFLGILSSLAVLAVAMVAYTLVTWVAFEYGVVLNMVFPYFALLATFVLAYLFRYFTEVRHSRHTERAFSKYVSHHVVKQILDHPERLKLGGEKKEMTVLFSDIAGFTTLSEKATPEKLVEQLNEYLDAMTVIIMDHDGTVDKYIGDAIMAFWGAPIPQKDHATRACLTALEYQKRLVELRALWVGRGQLPFSARIGLNTGPMVVGNMGSHRRFDYTVIGDAVNLGARLEGVNKFFDTNILISETTYEEAKHAVEVREIDLITVKGKTRPVRIYELLCKKGELSDLQKQLNKLFHEGLLAYRKQEWDEAVDHFKKALKLFPEDGPSKTYIERCGVLRHEKLPTDWDGSYTLKTK